MKTERLGAAAVAVIAAAIVFGACGSSVGPKAPSAVATGESTTTTAIAGCPPPCPRFPPDASETTSTTADPSGTDAEIGRHQTKWKQGRAMKYHFDYFEENMVGGCRFVITVNGEVVTSARSTGRNPACFSWADKNQPPTIDAVFRQIASSPGDVKVSYGDLGIPGRVAVDPIRNAIDDEYAFGAQNYVVLAP